MFGGVVPPGSVLSRRSSSQRAEPDGAHKETRFASVPSVASVSLFAPLSSFVTTAPAVPSTMFARLNAVAAAFWRPGLGPEMPACSVNSASEKLVAAVVSSFTVTSVDGAGPMPPASPATPTTDRSVSLLLAVVVTST